MTVSPRLWMTTFAALVFVIGLSSGLVIDRVWLTRPAQDAGGTPRPAPPNPPGGPPPERLVQDLDAALHLTDDQRRTTEAYIKQLTDAKTFGRPIVTQVSSLRAFYPAESYHQHYAMLHPDSPYIATYDLPKVAALKERFAALYREEVSSK